MEDDESVLLLLFLDIDPLDDDNGINGGDQFCGDGWAVAGHCGTKT
jgi:hypothetical protein